MTITFVFWFSWCLFLLFGWRYWPRVQPVSYAPVGGHLVLVVMLLCLGLHVFGVPIKSG